MGGAPNRSMSYFPEPVNVLHHLAKKRIKVADRIKAANQLTLN